MIEMYNIYPFIIKLPKLKFYLDSENISLNYYILHKLFRYLLFNTFFCKGFFLCQMSLFRMRVG